MVGEAVVLTDETNYPLAILEIKDIFERDAFKEVLSLFNTTDPSHPYIEQVLIKKVKLIGGPIFKVGVPPIHSLDHEISTPEQVKKWKSDHHIKKLVGFQTRNPLHRAHVEAIARSLNSLSSESVGLLLQPTISVTQAGDIPASVRMSCYKAILTEFDNYPIKLSAISLPMRMAGPKEALLHALVRKNYGCTHFIVGRDHAGPSTKKMDGASYFEAHEAYTLAKLYEPCLGIKILPCEELFYVRELDSYQKRSEIDPSYHVESISGTKLREMLSHGQHVPSWFSYPQVMDYLKHYYQSKKGLCIYFTGLPSSGKSTLCQLMKTRLEQFDGFKRNVVILDADVLRKHLGSELGFSKEDRSKNVRRIGYVASKIVESGGICLVANIAPFSEDREYNRAIISQAGKYVEVFVDVPVDTCAERDPKGLYQGSRQGIVKQMTGVSQNYETPFNPEIVLYNTGNMEEVIETLENQLYPLIQSNF
jgi:sulfate adenylyltransferase